METDISKNVKWKLKKVNKFWFLDIGGKLKWLNMLNKAIEVFMEENIIFADDIMYQVSEESDGEVIITEVKSIIQKDKTLDVKKDNTVFQTEKDINPGAREDLGEILGMPLEDSVIENDGDDHTLDDEQEENYDIGSDIYLKKKDSVIENDGKDHTLDDEQEENYNIGSDRYLKGKDSVIENDGEDHTLDDEQEENYDIGSDIYSKRKDSVIENNGKIHTLDDEQEENYDFGSDIYLKKKGKVWRFIDRIKQIKKKKPGLKKTEEPLYEAAPNYLNDSLRDDLSGIDFDDEDNSFKEQVDDYANVSFVSDKKKVTAMFDFEKLSEEEISFKMFDELTILEDIVSENPAWRYAEHLVTGEKGFVPVAYITQTDHNLIAQEWWHYIDRDGAIELLTNLHRPTPGTYLIRPSNGDVSYVLSMIVPATYNISQNIAHYAIRPRQGRLYISQNKQFSDLFDLVDHYKREADGLRCKLVISAPRQKPIVYPMSIEVQRKSIEIIKSIKIGKFGVLYEGKLCNIFDVTIVTECKSEVERFLAEANHLNKFLHSKHLVRVIAVVLEPKPFMIVLGETVQDTLQYYLEKCDQKTISFKRLTNIAAEIAKGMAFLEDNGIVHGNLKTENVLICENDKLKLLHPKLIKLMRTSDNDGHKEGETEWQWTAPEVVADESVLCTKSDVWSFGVVMYEIITFGGVPYAGLEKEETLQRLLKAYFRQPIPAQCPDEFYSTILQCWHQIPDCRLTFSFLYNYLDDFENASESEKFLKDYKLKLINPHTHKKGTLKIETEEQTRGKLKTEKSLAKELDDPDEYALVNIKTDTDIDQTASNKDVDITPGFDGTPLDDFTADLHDDQSTRNRIVDITPGFDVTALRGFTAETNDQISFDPGDIITNIEPINDDWWKGTTAKGIRGLFQASYVEVREITYAEVKNQDNVQKLIERMQLK